MDNYGEMVNVVLPWVAKVNRAITWPVLQKKTGMDVVSAGKNFGEIQTNLDVGISKALLDGAPKLGISGLCAMYPGSFSEEQDSLERMKSLVIYEVDPLDGTGDLKKTYQTNNVMSPTTLITKLERKSVADPFAPVAGMIFEVLNEYALVSDGHRLGLYKIAANGATERTPFDFWWSGDERTGHFKTERSVVHLNRRYSYPQNNYDIEFKKFCDEIRLPIIQVPVGGAGMQALQFFRQYINPPEGKLIAFEKLEGIDMIFNCQPDWKTWDTDPANIIAEAIANRDQVCMELRGFKNDKNKLFGWPKLDKDILGKPLTANAAAPDLKGMWHCSGCIMAVSYLLERRMLNVAGEFMGATGKNLLEINY